MRMKITLKAARVNAGLTQKELATLMNRDVTTIWNWENKKTKMSLNDFKKACSVLGVPEEFIFFEN